MKEIEYRFRGNYLKQCKGINSTHKKWNFEKNPLENMSIPTYDLIKSCITKLDEKKYSLDDLKKDQDFLTQVEELTIKFVEVTELTSLMTQRESEYNENKLIDAQEEEEKDGDEEQTDFEEVEEFDDSDEENNAPKENMKESLNGKFLFSSR